MIKMVFRVPYTDAVRFLWVSFQIIDLCDAASDEDIRQILEHLPEGLYDTFTRIFIKIAKSGSKATVLKAMMWMVCARRPLRVEELQEALAFDSTDKAWNVDKIPDGAKIIRSCHGLVLRDAVSETVRLAHHTVQQYLVSPPSYEEVTLGAHWPELSQFRRNSDRAEEMAGSFCVTYLCFSDFETAVSCINDDYKFNLATAFKDRGPISIPAALGLGKKLHSLPYKFFGSQNNFKMPDIDYSKYLNVTPRDRRPSPDFKSKFAILEYVIEYWPWHVNCLQWSTKSKSLLQFWDLVQHKSLAFEFRPWGPNQHFGPNGCKGCPAPDSNDLEPKDLPSMGLVHWAAETGHLRAFDRVEPPLHEYLKHERHHDETLLIACRHRQDSVVKLLLDCQTFNFSDGRAIVAACTSGSLSILDRLLQAKDTMKSLPEPNLYSPSILENFGPVALYQAASNGHKGIVEILLALKAEPYVSDMTTGLTSLQIAAKNGHLKVVRALCTVPLLEPPRGRMMDAPHESTGMKALHYAAVNGHAEIVSFLLEQGLGCDDQNSLGETALIKASQQGHTMVAKALIAAGADPLIRGGKLDNPDEELYRRPIALHHAAANGHDNVLVVLPYSDLVCGNRETNALHLGVIYGHSNVVQALLSKDAGIESEDAQNMTALHFASENGHKQVVLAMLDRRCSIDPKAKEGLTALHLAAMAAKPGIIKLLVARGAALTVKTSAPVGNTALHLAVCRADADTIRALVDLGASLEDRNMQGETALDYAVFLKSWANVRTMIELGADWTHDGALLRAVDLDNHDILNALLKRLSTATAKERNHAAATIERVMNEGPGAWNKTALRILWERSKEGEALGSSDENLITGPEAHSQDG